MLLLLLSLSSNLTLNDIKMTQVMIMTQVVIKHVIELTRGGKPNEDNNLNDAKRDIKRKTDLHHQQAPDMYLYIICYLPICQQQERAQRQFLLLEG